MSRNAILQRYLDLRVISSGHHNAAFAQAAHAVLMDHARCLGTLLPNAVIAGSEEELALLADLAVYAAKPGRTRALDRYARHAAPASGSDDALVLDAMRAARFSLWRFERLHDTVGSIITDLFRGGETWLMDTGAQASMRPGEAFASRIYQPCDFAMTAGFLLPVDRAVLEGLLQSGPAWGRARNPAAAAEDPRIAAALYREAIALGITDRVAFRDASLAA